jgi:hypothetical protein
MMVVSEVSKNLFKILAPPPKAITIGGELKID